MGKGNGWKGKGSKGQGGKGVDFSSIEEWKKQVLQAQVDWFYYHPSAKTYSFDYSLSGLERKFVHKVAEDSGIMAESFGEGEWRYIQLSWEGGKDVDKGKGKAKDGQGKFKGNGKDGEEDFLTLALEDFLANHLYFDTDEEDEDEDEDGDKLTKEELRETAKQGFILNAQDASEEWMFALRAYVKRDDAASLAELARQEKIGLDDKPHMGYPCYGEYGNNEPMGLNFSEEDGVSCVPSVMQYIQEVGGPKCKNLVTSWPL